MLICPNCGAQNPVGTPYCPHCGAAQSQQPAWKQPAAQSPVASQPVPPAPQSEPQPVYQSAPQPVPQSEPQPVHQSAPQPVPQSEPQYQQPVYQQPPQQPAYQPPVYQQPQPTYQQPNYQQPQYQQPNYPPQQPVYPAVPPQPPVYDTWTPMPAPRVAGSTRAMGIIAMVLGIFSICLMCYMGINLLLSIPAIILGAIAKKRTPPGAKCGMATAGLVTGIIGTVLGILWLIALQDSEFFYDLPYYIY